MKQQWTLRRKLYNGGMRGLVWLCAGLTCALLIFLIGYIFYRGVPGLSWQLISGQTSYIRNTVGILPNLLNTLYIILVAMVVVLPLGVGAAIYLTEYAASGRLVRIIEFAAETLTGIPSIIFGLVGMMLFVPANGTWSARWCCRERWTASSPAVFWPSAASWGRVPPCCIRQASAWHW